MSTLIDPRGPRFGAAVTAVVLVLALVLGPRWGVIPLALQAFAFALGAFLGVRRQPYGALYARLIRPRLAPPTELEDPRPPRFAQGVGLVFALAALAGALANLPVLLFVATAFALVAALLNAVFGFCLGCEMYLLGVRLLRRPGVEAAR